jgi:hypothetical protein
MLLRGPCEAGTPLVSWGSCAPGTQGPSFSYNTVLPPTSPRIPITQQQKRKRKSKGSKTPKHSPAPKRNDLKESDLVDSKVLCT